MADMKSKMLDTLIEMEDAQRTKFLDDMDAMHANIAHYFDNSENWTKSATHFGIANIVLNHRLERGQEVDPEKIHQFINVAMDFADDFQNGNVPFVDGTKVFVDLFKGLELPLKYDMIDMDYIKEDSKKWHDLTIKNVDFKEVENAIENKEILKTIVLRNCTLDNCNVDNLQYIAVSRDHNTIVNEPAKAKDKELSKENKKVSLKVRKEAEKTNTRSEQSL